MTIARARRIGVPIAAAFLALLFASAASAAANPFGCRASVARVTLLSATIAEPITANPATAPCASDNHGLNSVAVTSQTNNLVEGGPASAVTFSSTSQDTTTGAVAPGASALASIYGVSIPTPNGIITVVGPIVAQAAYACNNGALTSSSQSTLDVIYVNGQKTVLPAPGAPTTIQLGGGAYVAVNEKIQTSTSITERVLDVHLASLADVVVGEAKVTLTAADPCAGTTGGPPGTNPCPNGSTYDPALLVCVIVLPGGQTIIVSPPFQGPTGGTVVPLGTARKKYKSACLYGPGPQFAIVGTNGPDRINGTTHADRILGLGGNDRIAGRGGADCIDGGAGNDRIWAGNGNNRVYGGTGNDRVAIQNGNSYVNLGPGNDRAFLGNGNDVVYAGPGTKRIAVGRGNDVVHGGPGNNRISLGSGQDKVYTGGGTNTVYVGLGQSQVFGGPGHNRFWSRSDAVSFNCGRGHDLVFAILATQPYARTHGCTNIRTVRPIKPNEPLGIK